MMVKYFVAVNASSGRNLTKHHGQLSLVRVFSSCCNSCSLRSSLVIGVTKKEKQNVSFNNARIRRSVQKYIKTELLTGQYHIQYESVA